MHPFALPPPWIPSRYQQLLLPIWVDMQCYHTVGLINISLVSNDPEHVVTEKKTA